MTICRSHPDVPKGNLCMRALCLPVTGFGTWGQMGRRQRAQGLVMAPLEALNGATKSVVTPGPQSPLPEAAAGTAVMSGIGTETGNGTGTETGNGTGTETGNGTEIETETERALSAGRTRSLNAGPLGRGTLSMCMGKT